MADYEIVSWRGVPALVEAGDEHGRVTRPLSARFQALIDSAAMQLRQDDEDAYLEAWQRGPREHRPGTAAEVAEAVASDLERRFPEFIGRILGQP